MRAEVAAARRSAPRREWWEAIVRSATSDRDLESVFALRYRVYVEEYGKPYPSADHERRLLSDEWDALSTVLVAERDGRVAGTIRGTLGSAPGFAEAHADVFGHLEEVRAVGWHRVACGSRLVVDAAARGHSRLAVALMVAIYAWAVRQGAVLCLCHTVAPLLPLMEKMGWQRRGEPFVHADSSTLQYPMVLVVSDQAHLQSVGSPLACVAGDALTASSARNMADRSVSPT
jgi:N-acyl-L-homoserine lactone synthetase